MQALLPSRRAVIALTLATFNLANAPVARADQPSPDAIVGKWAADDGTVKLDMFKAGSEYQARFLYGHLVVEADGVTMKKDVNNPDPALRNRSLKNIVFATGLHYGNGEWTDGSIYDASSGRTYNCKAEIEGGKLHLRGYLGVSALGQTTVLHRMP